MKTLLIVALFVVCTIAVTPILEEEVQQQFISYMQKYGKTYSSDEFPQRYANFKASVARAQARNANKRANYGITKFADMTPEEFKAKILMTPRVPAKPDTSRLLQPKLGVQAPADLDWRTKGAVTAVKDQGQCGSCWAFSTVENVESQWLLAGKANNDTLNLSEQQVVDCDDVDAGCNGGDPPSAYQYIMQTGGLETDKVYPYTAQDGTCNFIKADVVTTISNWKYACTEDDETTLQNNLVSWGPLSICVDAEYWQDYSSGVMTAWDCAWVNELDHCVELVGYQTTGQPTPFWIVRNSWGTDWGIDGYIWLAMGDNTCGMTNEATTSVV